MPCLVAIQQEGEGSVGQRSATRLSATPLSLYASTSSADAITCWALLSNNALYGDHAHKQFQAPDASATAKHRGLQRCAG